MNAQAMRSSRRRRGEPRQAAGTYSEDVFIGLNSLVRRQRRHVAVFTTVVGLAGAVVVAHSAMGHGHVHDVGGVVVMCLAVTETAAVAVGVAVALGAWLRRPVRRLAQVPGPRPGFRRAPASVPARAGPPLLQVFRL